MGSTLRPGYQAKLVHLHQARMCGHDAHAKAVRAAFRRGDCSLVNLLSVSIRFAGLIEECRLTIANVAVINLAMVDLHSHMLWIDGAEMNSRRDFQRFTDQNALPIFIAYLNIRNFYRRPILAYLRLPLAYMGRSAAAVPGKIFVRSRGRNIELLGVFLHHALRVEDRRDAAD